MGLLGAIFQKTSRGRTVEESLYPFFITLESDTILTSSAVPGVCLRNTAKARFFPFLLIVDIVIYDEV